MILVFDNDARVTIPDTGALESALAWCKDRGLGGRLYADRTGGPVLGYVRRTASGGGWNAYYTEEGQP